MLRFLADDGLLARVRYVSSVSGGSVAAGLFAMGYGRVGEEGFTRASSLLADAFDDWWFGGRHLTELPADLRWIINAASVTTGVRFAFERDVVGDYVVGRVRTAETFLRIGEAVASSAAVPGARAPFEVKGANFPCAQGHQVKLLDGCVYDNIGLQGSTARLAPLVAINAGGHFRTGAYGKLPTSAISSARTRCCTGSRRQFAGSSWSSASGRGRRRATPVGRLRTGDVCVCSSTGRRRRGSGSSGGGVARGWRPWAPPSAPWLADAEPSYVVVDEIVGEAVGLFGDTENEQIDIARARRFIGPT